MQAPQSCSDGILGRLPGLSGHHELVFQNVPFVVSTVFTVANRAGSQR
jgi:hypothetical protein